MIKQKAATVQFLKKAQNDLEKRVSISEALVNNLCSLTETCRQSLLTVANLKERVKDSVRNEILFYYVKHWLRCYLGVLVRMLII